MSHYMQWVAVEADNTQDAIQKVDRFLNDLIDTVRRHEHSDPVSPELILISGPESLFDDFQVGADAADYWGEPTGIVQYSADPRHFQMLLNACTISAARYWTPELMFFDMTAKVSTRDKLNERIQAAPERQFIVLCDYHA